MDEKKHKIDVNVFKENDIRTFKKLLSEFDKMKEFMNPYVEMRIQQNIGVFVNSNNIVAFILDPSADKISKNTVMLYIFKEACKKQKYNLVKFIILKYTFYEIEEKEYIAKQNANYNEMHVEEDKYSYRHEDTLYNSMEIISDYLGEIKYKSVDFIDELVLHIFNTYELSFVKREHVHRTFHHIISHKLKYEFLTYWMVYFHLKLIKDDINNIFWTDWNTILPIITSNRVISTGFVPKIYLSYSKQKKLLFEVLAAHLTDPERSIFFDVMREYSHFDIRGDVKFNYILYYKTAIARYNDYPEQNIVEIYRE